MLPSVHLFQSLKTLFIRGQIFIPPYRHYLKTMFVIHSTKLWRISTGGLAQPIVKMNILPRVNFVCSMLPTFLWRGKRPRIKLRERQAGGLSLPNFKFYKWAFTLRPLLTWFQPDAQMSWQALQERMLAPYSFANILHSNISAHQCRMRFGPIISYLLFIFSIQRS